ncbi:MAG: hypothetical protein OEW19_18785 [Acidobacteriota bacterium]|nr:hypothetical protein [Acidobacteriota bacterium]
MTNKKNVRFALMLALAAVVAAACAPKSPAERVARLRSFYTARPIGFIVDAKPETAMATAKTPAGAGDEAPESAAVGGDEGVEAADLGPLATRQDVLLDILLQHDSPEKLPGITLDISMVDAAEKPVASWKVWVDTAKLPKATGTQFTNLLEDVPYEEGYAFSVEVRHPIPVEERGEYREFAQAEGG